MKSKTRAAKSGRSARRDLVLAGGSEAKLRKASGRDWTKAKAAAFLTALAETCNVALACREANISSAAVYRRRKTDAAFRAAWREAIAAAYRRLELALLERAFNGTEKVVTRKDGNEERVRDYPNAIALQLLKMHRDEAVAAEREYSPEETHELRQRLLGKLERLRRRNLGGEDCGG